MILFDGATGGLGRHLAPRLAARGIVGAALRSRLEDPAALRRELEAVRPAGGEVTLLQLAARVSVPACEADPEGTFAINVVHTRATVETFLRWASARGYRAGVVYVSSGHVYAAVERGKRLTEEDATAPRSVYARSKLEAERVVRAAGAEAGASVLVARVFGLVAPGQPPHYVLPALVRRVRERRLAGVPGLSSVRDYLDARDVCDDLLALAEIAPDAAVRAGVVNVCSGEGLAIRDLLREVVRAVCPDEESALMAEVTEAPGRPDDVPWIVGDPSRFIAFTGRPPRRIPLPVTVHDAIAAG